MALVRIPDENRTLRESAEITAFLAGIGIAYEKWDLPASVAENTSAEEILAHYAPQI